MIYALGDSHSREAERVPGVVVAFTGPTTLHRFGLSGVAIQLFQSFHTGDTTGIFLLFGEIDIRCHVGRQSSNPSETLSTLAEGAIQGIRELHTVYRTRVVFCAVTPPSVAHDENPEFPIVGSLSDRARWTSILNVMMRDRVPFYDPYEPFRDTDGTLPAHFSDGSVHLHPRYGPQAFGPLVERIISETFR